MTNRRSFLKLLGASPAAAPLVAKELSDAAIGEAFGIGINTPNAPDVWIGDGTASPSTSWKSKLLRFILNPTFPPWLEDELLERNRHVTFLDPDIASKRSWSMNVKIATQRQRNIARARVSLTTRAKREIERQEFGETHGIWL